MKITIKTESPEATRRLGADFGSLLSGPHTILLTGGMGAGKTAVTKGIVEGKMCIRDRLMRDCRTVLMEILNCPLIFSMVGRESPSR